MKCLACYKPLEDETEIAGEYHHRCARRVFRHEDPPAIQLRLRELDEQLLKVNLRGAMAGVQTKLSMTYEGRGSNGRLTIVGLWGEYILKPPSTTYGHLPENEDLTMHLATIAGIDTADHTLVRLEDGTLAYLTRRFDRSTKTRGSKNVVSTKLHVEDMCQLTERLTDDKYKGSMEQVGRMIRDNSEPVALNLLRFFERTLFSFLTGNADMHLKNWSLIRTPTNEHLLSPAYDLLSTKLAVAEDEEEMALPLNGKKSNLRRKDFDSLAESIGLPTGLRDNTYRNFQKRLPKMNDFIGQSFLSQENIERYLQLILSRASRIGLIPEE